MRVVYYTQPYFLETALELARELSKRCELHVMIELSPQSAKSVVLDSRVPLEGRSGLRDARTCFDAREDAVVLDYLSEARSVTAVVHRSRWGAANTWLTSYRAARHIRKLRPDVLHLDDTSRRFAPVVWLLRRFPLVINLHDARIRRGEENWKTSLARGLTLSFARKVIVHSRFCLEALRSDRPAIGDRAEHVPFGACHIYRRFSAGLRPPVTGPTVLFLGRLAPYKGLDLLYAAAPIVAAQIPGVEFVIAGQPVMGYRLPESPPLQRGGTIRVLAEHVDVRTLARLFEESRIVVCPYAQATQSGVLMTAYAFGKPVVATAVGGFTEYVHPEKTGLLVPPGDPLALANAIVKVLSDQALYSRLCNGIQDFDSSENSWGSLAQRTLQVYKQAMEPGAQLHRSAISVLPTD